MTPKLETIWEQFSARLRGFIRGRIRDHAAAEDVLQEVFLAIHKQLLSVREAGRLEAWIWRITRNAIAGHYRRNGRSEPLAPEVDPATDAEPERPDLTGCIRQFVRQLEPEFREALLLTEWRGVSQKEMAQRLGLSDSGAKSRVQRARQQVKQMLLGCCEVELDRRGTVVEMRRRGKGQRSCESTSRSEMGKSSGACSCGGAAAASAKRPPPERPAASARSVGAKRPRALSPDGNTKTEGR